MTSKEGRDGVGDAQSSEFLICVDLVIVLLGQNRCHRNADGKRHWERNSGNGNNELWIKTTGFDAIRSFAGNALSFACSALHALLAHSAALIRSFARSFTHCRAHRKDIFVYKMNASISYRFNPLCDGEIYFW